MKTRQLMDAGCAVSAVIRVRCHRAAVVAIAWFAVALGVPAVHAQDVDAQVSGEPVSNSEVGHSTGAWLALQRSNAQAAPALPMLGAEAGYAYGRYMKSFDTAIPASFGSMIQTGSGQGGGGGTASVSGTGAY
ncbi:MAG TPA: DUF3613 domain-containing protein [Paraburkholderia sp.]|nr:DUF3613 domain-containing protein [Paraburkholderia sp.]